MIELSSFTRVTMTPDEVISGSILSAMQLGNIQNIRVDIAEQKLNLKFTPNDIHSYTQQEAYLSGQLDILKHLIDLSDSTQAQRNQPVSQSPEE